MRASPEEALARFHALHRFDLLLSHGILPDDLPEGASPTAKSRAVAFRLPSPNVTKEGTGCFSADRGTPPVEGDRPADAPSEAGTGKSSLSPFCTAAPSAASGLDRPSCAVEPCFVRSPDGCGRPWSSYLERASDRAAFRTYGIAGFDEAGRGALAGPVVVGCVHLDLVDEEKGRGCFSTYRSTPSAEGGRPANAPCEADTGRSSPSPLLTRLVGVDDSKRLSPAKREALYQSITQCAAWGVGASSAREIDRLGIVAAVSLAARRAYRGMGHLADLFLCDRGLSVNPPHAAATSRPLPAELAFTKGDARSLHIACASIVAKVARDRLMTDLDARFPGYGFAIHKGYGTAAHRDAIARLGRSPLHRRSFHVK